MSHESNATELEVAMLYSEMPAKSEDEDDVWLRRLHEGVAAATRRKAPAVRTCDPAEAIR